MNQAAVIGINASYFLLTFLPPVLWLMFYLHEDRHPEPKRLLLLTFVGGMASVALAIVSECLFMQIQQESCRQEISYTRQNILIFFLGIAFIEEYVKYLAVKLLILRRKDFDEPVDAMIYLMTAALGFAAIENVFFVLPIFQENLRLGLEVTTNRFLGANLLHALSSAIVGFFLARAWFSPYRRHAVAIGIIIASLFHASFNYLILIRSGLHQGTLYLVLLLAIMAVIVFIDFERLRGRKQPEDRG